MSEHTNIAWCNHSFSPVWGCTKVGLGCKNCYASVLTHNKGMDIWGPDKPRKILTADTWKQPYKWNRMAEKLRTPARVFCGSMCDVFEDHPTVHQERAKLWPMI